MALRQIGAPLDLTTSASGKIRIVFNDPKALREVERLPNPPVGNREVAEITRTRIAFFEPGTGLLAAATSIFNASGKLTDAGLKAVAGRRARQTEGLRRPVLCEGAAAVAPGRSGVAR
jgi:hypothetical protein